MILSYELIDENKRNPYGIRKKQFEHEEMSGYILTYEEELSFKITWGIFEIYSIKFKKDVAQHKGYVIRDLCSHISENFKESNYFDLGKIYANKKSVLAGVRAIQKSMEQDCERREREAKRL